MEDYYQQIGRAGRDGAPATCTLVSSDSDFAKYGSDFYVGSLTAKARQAVLASTASLRKYASECTSCRWATLLALLGEDQWTRSGTTCGVCDNCLSATAHSSDLERDFSAEARVLLLAVQSARGSWTHVEKALKALDPASLRPRRSAKCLKEFMPGLVAAGLIGRTTVKGEYSAYDVYALTPRGAQTLPQLTAKTTVVRLPVPPAVRAEEKAAADAAAAKRAEVSTFAKQVAGKRGN